MLTHPMQAGFWHIWAILQATKDTKRIPMVSDNENVILYHCQHKEIRIILTYTEVIACQKTGCSGTLLNSDGLSKYLVIYLTYPLQTCLVP